MAETQRKRFQSDEMDRFQVRLPEGLRNQIWESAEANGRSMNSEAVARLQAASDQRSLRDWFAGQALAGYVASAGNETLSMADGETVERALAREAKNCAEWCYAQADAMLAARSR